MDKKNLFSHFDYSKSIILYRADSPENEIKNFYNFTNETSYKSYSIKYKFSDILFMIQILANKYDEEDRWIITAFLLRTFTRAKFYEIFEIIELENTDASRKRTHRAIKKLSTTFKSELKKELSRMVEPKKCLLSAAGREQTLSVV